MPAYSAKLSVDNQSYAKEIKRLATAFNAATAVVQAANATAAAGTMTGAYVQADVQRIATLADALKTDLNALIAKLKTAGLMATS